MRTRNNIFFDNYMMQKRAKGLSRDRKIFLESVSILVWLENVFPILW